MWRPDPKEFQRVAKARASLEETVTTFEAWRQATEELVGAKEVLKESQGDPELREMAEMEMEELDEKLVELEGKLKNFIVASGSQR